MHSNDEKLTEILLRHGADPYVGDKFGRTAIHYGIKFNCSRVVIKLVFDYNNYFDKEKEHYF